MCHSQKKKKEEHEKQKEYCNIFNKTLKMLHMQVEREVGGGTGMGNTCKSMANSFQCMTKTAAIL